MFHVKYLNFSLTFFFSLRYHTFMVKQDKRVSITLDSKSYDTLMRMFPTTPFSEIVRYLIRFYFDSYKETFNVKN